MQTARTFSINVQICKRDIVDRSLKIMTTHHQRAVALVRSFTQVAVDQWSDDIRSFNMKTYLDKVVHGYTRE